MANEVIATEASTLLNLLKVWYMDKVESLLFRNSPVLKAIDKVRVEGKEQRFSGLYGTGGAVSSNFLKAEEKAAENVKACEWHVTPGVVWSVTTYTVNEVRASMTKRGAYMKIAGSKMFAATEAFRKALATSLYGRGYGEMGVIGAAVAFTANTPAQMTLSEDVIIKISQGMDLDVKQSIAATTVQTTLTVDKIDGDVVTVIPSDTYTSAATDVICLADSMDENGAPAMPVGLDAWLPIVEGRDAAGSVWPAYIAAPFFNVTRNVDTEGLAGSFVVGTSTEKKTDTIQKLLRKVRRLGSNADMIVLNDEDWLTVSNEIQSTNTYFTQTSTKAKRSAAVGFASYSAAFSTNFIDNVIDDPYCPAGKFYILDKDTLEYFSYTNSEAIKDGVADNEPGKQDPETFDNKGKEDEAYKLNVDDYITIQPGSKTRRGPSTEVSLQFLGSLVVLNPSVNGVGLFYNADGYGKVLGFGA
jgi:hypothetical protein